MSRRLTRALQFAADVAANPRAPMRVRHGPLYRHRMRLASARYRERDALGIPHGPKGIDVLQSRAKLDTVPPNPVGHGDAYVRKPLGGGMAGYSGQRSPLAPRPRDRPLVGGLDKTGGITSTPPRRGSRDPGGDHGGKVAMLSPRVAGLRL